VKIESGDSVFAEQVLIALKKWRFSPSTVTKTLTATMTFALAGDPTEHKHDGEWKLTAEPGHRRHPFASVSGLASPQWSHRK
jgi:hypothetical protein